MKKISGILPLISVVSIVMIISGIVAVNAEKILTSGFAVLGIVMLHNLAGMGLGLGASRLFRVEYTKATAIAIEVGMQNSGLAITLATANFAANPFATLPGAIFSVWHNISGSVFASIRRNGYHQENAPETRSVLSETSSKYRTGFSHPRCICKEFFTKFTPALWNFCLFHKAGVFTSNHSPIF